MKYSMTIWQQVRWQLFFFSWFYFWENSVYLISFIVMVLYREFHLSLQQYYRKPLLIQSPWFLEEDRWWEIIVTPFYVAPTLFLCRSLRFLDIWPWVNRKSIPIDSCWYFSPHLTILTGSASAYRVRYDKCRWGTNSSDYSRPQFFTLINTSAAHWPAGWQ